MHATRGAVLISGITATLLQYKQQNIGFPSCICQSEREDRVREREESESRPEENQRRERNTNICTLLPDLLI